MNNNELLIKTHNCCI